MAYFTLLVAISIAAVAAWYSIIGLMAIFAAAAIPIAIMGGVLTAHSVLNYGTILDILSGRNLINDLYHLKN